MSDKILDKISRCDIMVADYEVVWTQPREFLGKENHVCYRHHSPLLGHSSHSSQGTIRRKASSQEGVGRRPPTKNLQHHAGGFSYTII